MLKVAIIDDGVNFSRIGINEKKRRILNLM